MDGNEFDADGSEFDAVVVGGGVAGLTAGTYLARHELDALVVDDGESILRRNAHLENVPGFPAGVNARLFLDLLSSQADRAGCERRDAAVERVRTTDDGFAVETGDGATVRARYVVAATKNETSYLDGVEGVDLVDRGKTYVDADERGRTGVEGLYAAGRLAGKPHQTAVAAGHGAEVAVTLLEDDDRPFYHDWVAPEGYFTGRGRDVPPGCEELGDEERRRRERESLAVMRDHFDAPHPEDPEQHPSVADEE
ncbi:FAD-dependent oxidoreductase [Halorussus halobius]|uniref:FAD-dependent oxidoreductase n=1 Tax=Halorussus halobius TaxID=1710537 RepID=UPI001092A3E2|nr:FAD-dependent oxidoreductase [Halorussus halobius]